MTTSLQGAGSAGSNAPVKRLFVTGAGGYVGRNIVRHFIAKGVAVVGLVRNAAAADMVRALGAESFLSDILNPAIAAGMAGCDALVHAAADTDHGLGGAKQRRVNEDGTSIVIEAASKAGVATLIHLSSDSVLADGNPLVNVDETTPYPSRPAGSYSRTKAVAERIARAADGASMRVVVLRPRMVWGRDDTTALPILAEMARSGKLAWIGGGHYATSTTHIANLCDAVELALAKGKGGEVYFIADAAPVEFRAFVTALLETQSIAVPEKAVPRALVRTIAQVGQLLGTLSGGRIIPPLTMQAYATSAVEITLDIGKARRDLGYTPGMSREVGLEELRILART
jgi:nucleoside-diphosphate-sugar epimerase